jgi:serine/threonine protein kinase
MYAAPERLRHSDSGIPERHGTGSDIFSLGCLFAEMITVLSSRSVYDFQRFCTDGQDNSRSRPLYAFALDEFTMWLQDVYVNRRKSSSVVDIFNLVESILHTDREKRPSAVDVMNTFERATEHKLYNGK